jgi:hypothetical protein
MARRVAAGLLAVLPATAPSTAMALPVRAAVTAVSSSTPRSTLPSVGVTVVGGVAEDVPLLRRIGPGDSVVGVAQELAGGDAERAAEIADWIVEHNLGRPMPDGQRFTSPAYVEVGWTLQVPPGSTRHVVVPGDSYWRIADEHLGVTLPHAPTPHEILELTEELIDANSARLGHADPTLLRPGEIVVLLKSPVSAPDAVDVTVPPVDERPVDEPDATDAADDAGPPTAEPAPTPAPAVVAAPSGGPAPASVGARVPHSSDVPAYVAFGIGASAMLSAGALALVESRRRRGLRAATVGARLAEPSLAAVATETELRAMDRRQVIARLDLAVRAAAGELAEQRRHVVAAIARRDGAIEVLTDAPATMAAGVRAPTPRGWSVPAAVSLEQLAPLARRGGLAHPAMVELGAVDAGSLFVDLEAFGLITVDGPPEATRAIARAIATGIAISPLGGATRLVTTGFAPLSGVSVGTPAQTAPDLDAALDAAVASLGSIAASALGDVTTFALRARSHGETWEPSVVVSVGQEVDPATAAELRQLAARPGRGLGVVVDRAIEGVGSTVRADGARWRFEPLGLDVVPVGLEDADVAALQLLLDESEAASVGPDPGGAVGHDEPGGWREPEWRLMVRVLGPVEVVGREATAVSFERSKAVELVAWLAHHRDRPLRMAARTALWETDVRDATFANVVSDARRAMARAVVAPDGEEWLGRTLTELLPLHPLVVTDADLLASRLAAAHATADDHAAIEVLRPGLALVRDLPFAGTPYLWPDAEGITSSLVLLVTSAAATMGERCLAVGDVDGVFWATGQGLKALPGHEELVAIRMRAHAGAGDLAAVRQEWASYERALHADPWSDAEPSPKLVAIRRQLLAAER